MDGGTSIQVTVEGDRSKEKQQSSESPEAPSSISRVPLLDLTTLAPENNSSGKASITCMFQERISSYAYQHKI